jgi:manganese-dependent inorganic pyrophosphatase
MPDTIYVVGHKNPDTDTVCSAIAYAELKKALGFNAVPVIQGPVNSETKYVLGRFKVDAPEIMASAKGLKVILVDHNEMSQTIDGIEEDNIMEIIDHHKIGDVKTSKPIFFLNEPLGCTATIIYDLYSHHGIPIKDEIKGLLLSAILSDTVIFKSPTTTQKDKDVAMALAKDLGIDVMELGKEQFDAKSDFGEKSKEDILEIDSKAFSFSNGSVIISQVELSDSSIVMGEKEGYLRVMRDKMTEKKALAFIFIVTDIIREGSELIIVSETPSIFEEAFGIELKDGSAYIPGLMSRKKQVVPVVEKALN